MRKALTACAIVFLPAFAFGYSSGPPDGRTGAPGQQTCWNSCHSSFPLNSGDGSFAISGPDFFQAGQSYTITVEIADPGQLRWGFEITPLNLGSVAITDLTNTQFSSSGGNSYVKHTSAGTHAGLPDGPVSWSFDWTAPVDPPSTVTFYAAGNAANNNGANTLDYIYTTTFTTNLMTSDIDDSPFGSLPTHLSMAAYPNPFNARATISFSLPVSGHTTLDIYNLQGQQVATLLDGEQSAGEYSVNWNADNLPSGIYFYRLSVGNLTSTQKITLLK